MDNISILESRRNSDRTKMTGSANERTTISATMSCAPSLATSLHSYASTSKLSLNNGAKATPKTEVVEENLVTDILEKAKFYTSLCLGKISLILNFSFEILSFIRFRFGYRNVSYFVRVCLSISYSICC